MQPIISVSNLTKTYASGLHALENINLEIRQGEIFALLGPNGAGKTTLISIICGIVNPTHGTILADGHDIIRDYRAARSKIGLVPQELTTDAFESVWDTVKFSRGLFGKPPNPAYLEKVLRDLSLWEKRDSKIMTLSGGMKRRVMIAKALSHEPRILFLDEPTAGVDVELRRAMWDMVRGLRQSGVTIILTTHYIQEAQEMADRIGVINKGRDHSHRGQGRADEEARQQEAHAAVAPTAAKHSRRAGRIASRAQRRRHADRVHLRHPAGAHRYRDPVEQAERARHHHQGPADERELPGGYFCQPRECQPMNVHAIRAIYGFELSRTWRTIFQSIASPVLSTSLYFIVFGAAIGSRMAHIDGVSYGAFIVPGLIMLSILTESVSNASFGIYMPKFTGTIYEILSAPISTPEIVIGYIGAAATKSVILGTIILITARLFVTFTIAHPVWMVASLLLTAVTFSFFGFLIGIWADGLEKLQIVPLMVVTPLTFLGGSFYSISMLPPVWQKVALFNPVVYLISGFRWSFYGISDVNIVVSFSMIVAFLLACFAAVWVIFRTGYKLKA